MILRIFKDIIHFIWESILYIFGNLLKVIKMPFKLLQKFFSGITKRLKFSISFKISVTYFILYIVIMLVITVSTSIGYFAYILNNFKNINVYTHDKTIESSIENLIEIYNKYNTNSFNKGISENTFLEADEKDLNESVIKLFQNKEINDIVIFDENYRNIFQLKLYDKNLKYTSNIILVLEDIITRSIYVHSYSFSHNGVLYHVNTYYNVDFLIKDTLYIIFIVFISATFGLLIFIPVVSRTSIRVIKPIRKLTDIAKTISVNNINTRLDLEDSQDELKELSETFNDMMDRIEDGYKSQQHFVSDASHELRTPIAVIKGYIDMLDRWGKNDRSVLDESITAIKNETDNMQDLIEKLLFIARNDKNTLVFTKEDFMISNLINEIKKECQMIDGKHIYDFYILNDANLYADRNRIKQAIRIFLENAVKFTPDGGKISILGFQANEYYAIRISDTGIGIAKEDLPKIFDRLYRTEQSRNKKIGGHGLGLSIAKIIILGHKGKIKVKSELGKGSQFTILLPRI